MFQNPSNFGGGAGRANAGRSFLFVQNSAKTQMHQIPQSQQNPIDLSQKRKSGNQEDTQGVPFITPFSESQKQNRGIRKTFFRPKIQAKAPSITPIANLTNEQKIRVATILHLNPPTPENLMFFLQQSNSKNPQVVQALTMIIDRVVNETPAPAGNSIMSMTNSPIQSPLFFSPQSYAGSAVSTPNQHQGTSFFSVNRASRRDVCPPISSFELNDVRYTHANDENVVMKKPLSIGNNPVDAAFHVPPLEQGMHLIVQCYIAGVAPSPIGWPGSLRVIVNGKVVKGPGICRFPVLDITTFLPECDVKIQCGTEMQHYYLVIRPSHFRTFSQIVRGLRDAPPQKEPEIDESVSIFDPLNGDVLKYPGRGSQCQHAQCFDLKEYIKRASLCRRWTCPICSKLCELKDLVFSHEMLQYIHGPTLHSEAVSTPEEFRIDDAQLGDDMNDPYTSF